MSLGSVQILHKSLEEAKRTLDDTNEAIQRISGRDPRDTYRNDRNTPGSRTRSWSDDYTPPAKRGTSANWKRAGYVVDDDFDPGDDETVKPSNDTIKSSVSAAPVPPRPIADTTADTASKQRNRRMFGMLMGTLQKFQKDSSQVTEQEKKRVEIENKLEQVAAKEKEQAAQQKKQLFDQRKLQKQLVGKLTSQLESAELYEEWTNHNKRLLGFIKTSTRPSIFYLPCHHNEATEALLEKTSTALKETIAARENETKLLLQDDLLPADTDPEQLSSEPLTLPTDRNEEPDEIELEQ